MRVAVVGSRDWPFPEMVWEKVRELHEQYGPALVIVSGGARGVDTWAEGEARLLGVSTSIHYPDWDLWGHDAGKVRNQYVVDDADMMVAFQLRGSSGTGDAMRKARVKGIPVEVIEAS